jgi:hypothetical protein
MPVGFDPALEAPALQGQIQPWPKPTALALPVSIHGESPVSPGLLVRAPVSVNAKQAREAASLALLLPPNHGLVKRAIETTMPGRRGIPSDFVCEFAEPKAGSCARRSGRRTFVTPLPRPMARIRDMIIANIFSPITI